MDLLMKLKIGLVVFYLSLNPVKAELPESSAITELSIEYLTNPKGKHYSSGQPSEKQFRQLAKLGIKHIVNLRPKSEQVWDEADFVTSLGMKYHFISVVGLAGVTHENALLLDQTLTEIGDEAVLVHCVSGNRVGGLIAIIERNKGHDTETAIAIGRQWGLKRLEPRIRHILSATTSQ
jgi:protein tyrosine phosphatase (PTP) superfamily phosphohydrolase (DUF442 family)